MVDIWRSRAESSKIDIVVTVDVDDLLSLEEAKKLKGVRTYVQEKLPGTCVRGWNLAAHHAIGQVLIAMSDDFVPPKKWDIRLEKVSSDSTWFEKPHVVQVSDGYINDLCTLAIITRPWYERCGYLFYPGYQSMFCDTELTYHAMQEKVLIQAPHLLFEHHHPDNRLRVRDQVDLVHASSQRYADGERLFKSRRAARFPADMTTGL